MRERLGDPGIKKGIVGKFLGVLIFLNNCFALDIIFLKHSAEKTILKNSSLISESKIFYGMGYCFLYETFPQWKSEINLFYQMIST